MLLARSELPYPFKKGNSLPDLTLQFVKTADIYKIIKKEGRMQVEVQHHLFANGGQLLWCMAVELFRVSRIGDAKYGEIAIYGTGLDHFLPEGCANIGDKGREHSVAKT